MRIGEIFVKSFLTKSLMHETISYVIMALFRTGTGRVTKWMIWKASKYDHKEYYRDREGRVVQVYSQSEKKGFDESFTKIAPMYQLDQFTAIKILETTKSKNKRRRLGL
jgi:hypothetical protein